MGNLRLRDNREKRTVYVLFLPTLINILSKTTAAHNKITWSYKRIGDRFFCMIERMLCISVYISKSSLANIHPRYFGL